MAEENQYPVGVVTSKGMDLYDSETDTWYRQDVPFVGAKITAWVEQLEKEGILQVDRNVNEIKADPAPVILDTKKAGK